MINIHCDLLTTIDEDELWLLIHIIKRAGEKLTSFPSNETLCGDTRWDIKKVQKIKKQLRDKYIISYTVQKNGISSNIYQVESDLIGVYVPGKKMGGRVKTDTPPTPETDTHGGAKADSQGGVKTDNEVLSNQVLSNEVERRAKEFYEKLKPYVATFDKKTLREFYDYWTELGEGQAKMRFEKQNVFEIEKRLARWKKNDDEKKPNYKSRTDQPATPPPSPFKNFN